MENENKQNETPNEETKAPTNEELMAEIAGLKAQAIKNKNALDKALKEKAEVTRLLRSKQTEEEQLAEEKKQADAEMQERMKELESFKRSALAKDRYIAQGMGAELATKAAEAEVSGDYDGLAQIQKTYTDALLKAKEAEWIKSRPQIQAGSGASKEEIDPFLAGFGQ